MQLHNEFTVGAPIERAWPLLLDIERVAACLPGASIEPDGGDGTFRGSMKVKLGPVTTTYRGVARMQDVDEDTHTASIAVDAREQEGQGMATAIITNRLVPEEGGTRVLADTELAITGRQAQFGRGIMEDVATRLLEDFAARLERELAGEPPVAQPGPRHDEAEALDLGGLLPGADAIRYAAAAAVAVALLVALIAWRRPRGFSITLRYRP